MKLKRILGTLFLAICSSATLVAQPLEWRGCMIDVSRHFFSLNFLKRQIDVLSKMGINVLHLHLTDAGGWRIQISAYPKLTHYAAWRTHSDWDKWWNEGDRTYLNEGTPNAYGGYYTQDELKELVRYAQLKGVTIVPEIEMPGHSEEVLEAYPELKCEGNTGKQGDMCPSNPTTYTFLKRVLDEVVTIFPSTYIHLGGDEAGKESWAHCPRCIAMAKQLHLSSTNALQDVFMRKMTHYVESLGRKAVVWDEALTDSLAPHTVIMVWRDAKTAHDAIAKGYEVVLSPTSHCYLDYYQDAPATQPRAFGGFLPFDSVYSLPIWEGIKGVQGNLWTEYIPTEAQAEYMLYPRMLAIASLGLNQQPKPSIQQMRKRAIQLYKLLKKQNINAFNLRKEFGQRKEYKQLLRHKGIGAKVTYLHPYSPYYTAQGDKTLTDGKRGSWQHGDKRWQGFIGDSCFQVVVDLGKPQRLRQIYAEFMQSDVAWIYFPKTLSISISNDNTHYEQLKNIVLPKSHKDIVSFKKMGWKGKTTARYIKLIGQSTGKGEWIFTDEIIVK